MKNCNHWKRLAAVTAWLFVIYTVLAVLPAGPVAAFTDKIDSGLLTAATPSVATPSVATPSQALYRITYADPPDLIVLEAGEADEASWISLLPRQMEVYTDDPENNTVLCGISWSVSHVRWDKQGIYSACGEIISPEGYVFGPYMEPYFDAVVSIHPQGTSQVMDVFTSLGYFGQTGHTWTFAMNVGQDMTPLVEKLERMTSFTGILDSPRETVRFTAAWDFSRVDPATPGIYPIYRHLKLAEDSVPPDLDPEQIFLPEYWETLPVLLSVEEPGQPQLYGVLENPDSFFGSYARLTDEEFEALEVWYSVDGGPWTLQTDEGLMETDARNYRIDKKNLEDGKPCSFYLKLGSHTSRILTVQTDDTPLVWFFWTLDGNRDGTIDVDFPSFNQPPPTDPTEEDPVQPPTNGSIGEPSETPTEDATDSSPENPPDGSNGSTPENPTDDATDTPPETSTDGSSGTSPGDRDNSSAGSAPAQPAGASVSAADSTAGETPKTADTSGQTAGDGPGTSVSRGDIPPTTGNAGPADQSAASKTDSPLLPMELVDQWVTQISGKRVKKLLELYPEHIVFQKEDVTVLVSSQWIASLQLKDNDILTIKVSPSKDHEVTILINQKEPPTPPVYETRSLDTPKKQTGGLLAGAVFLLFVIVLTCSLIVRRRTKA